MPNGVDSLMLMLIAEHCSSEVVSSDYIVSLVGEMVIVYSCSDVVNWLHNKINLFCNDLL